MPMGDEIFLCSAEPIFTREQIHSEKKFVAVSLKA